MSLLEEVRQAQRHAKIIRCSVQTLALTEDERVELDEAIADPTVQASLLAKVLRGRGHAISDDAVRRHRSRRCACANGS